MADEEHLDIDPCDKDGILDEDQNAAVKIAAMEAKYEKSFDAFDKAAGVKVAVQASDANVAAQDAPTQKEIDAFMAKMSPNQKGLMLAAYGVSPAAKKTRAPKGLYKTLCDDATKKIKPTIKYIKDNHNVHLECYMLGLYLKDITDDLPESDDHDAYKRWLTDNKEYFGLKKQSSKSGAGSTNVSVALGDLSIDQGSIDEDEDEEEGAGAGSD